MTAPRKRRFAPLTVAAALLLLAPPAATGQVPLDLHAMQAGPYEALTYDNSKTTIVLESGEYFFVVSNEGLTDTEYWVTQGGRRVTHQIVCCAGGEGLSLTQDGEYAFHFNGQGKFAIVKKEFVDSWGEDRSVANYTIRDHLAFAAARNAKGGIVCLRSQNPVDVQLLDSRFVLQRQANQTTRFSGPTTDGFYSLLFIQADQAGWVEVVATTGDCLPAPAPTPTPAPPSVGTAAPGAEAAFVAVLLALGLRRRWLG
jgi:hypothetical protein